MTKPLHLVQRATKTSVSDNIFRSVEYFHCRWHELTRDFHCFISYRRFEEVVSAVRFRKRRLTGKLKRGKKKTFLCSVPLRQSPIDELIVRSDALTKKW